jgi:hypothetical protein
MHMETLARQRLLWCEQRGQAVLEPNAQHGQAYMTLEEIRSLLSMEEPKSTGVNTGTTRPVGSTIHSSLPLHEKSLTQNRDFAADLGL